MERVASSQAVDYIEAYYKVALKNVIDNIGALVVEACLIRKLPTLFIADTVYDLQDTDVQGLAGESKEIVEERTRVMQKLNLLQNSLHDLKRLDKHGAAHSQRASGIGFGQDFALVQDRSSASGSQKSTNNLMSS